MNELCIVQNNCLYLQIHPLIDIDGTAHWEFCQKFLLNYLKLKNWGFLSKFPKSFLKPIFFSCSRPQFEVFHPTFEVTEVKGGHEILKCPNLNSDTTFNNRKTALIFKNVIGMFLRCTVYEIWINSLCCFGVNITFFMLCGSICIIWIKEPAV